MKRIILFFSLVAAVAFAQTATDANETNPADVAFTRAFISVEAGEVYPWGDLQDAVENSYYAGFGFRYTYWNDVDGVVMFNYSYFKPVPDDAVPYGVHQFSGKLGFDWNWNLIRPVIIGGGFVCNLTRSDLPDGVEPKEAYDYPGGTLGDNETEFGWYARINVPLWKFEKFRVGFVTQWEELWTLPKRSDMLTAGVYVERSLW